MKKTSVLSQICFIFTGVILCFNAFAQMYKWVDEEGNTHYTQQPPPAGIEGETLKSPTSVDRSESLEKIQKQKEYLDAEREKRQKKMEEENLAKEEDEDKKKKCQLAKDRLNSYISRPAVHFVQEDGSKVRATEEQRQEEIARSKEYIEKYCN